MIRVLLADDDALLRAGVAVVLGTAEGIVVVGEAADGPRAVELCRALAPDVVVMDVRMPGIDGIEATRRVPRRGAEPVVPHLDVQRRVDAPDHD